VHASDFHPQVNPIVFKQVVELFLYSAFVIRSRPGFGALITGAEPLNEPVFAHHKYLFVDVAGLVFVSVAIILRERQRTKTVNWYLYEFPNITCIIE